MTALTLTAAQRRELRAQAHHLNPVVLIGAEGLTASVMKEVAAALDAHGLIKVRVFSDERTTRDAFAQEICQDLGAAAVQHIGKLLVLWRPPAPKAKAASQGKAPVQVKVVKPAKRPGQKPEIKHLRVLGNQRLTAGGNIKKAKPRQASAKKQSLD
ncbi:ribosome assembly RNA-binding protein YhbY [Allofranklinella schreckenbergeri]|uniref:Ribosome assembly RNA-binding protein YhbY n=1 Tax=Allofranklinella schreckenbergeri TaxID=1076744 RepID=A0A3M6QCM1_9BURK|nr:ribosome assembly RNA-binding protein YhbY [Allofranklinella schreckenbergeri]RMX00635.1 ribosome assembly RNA-binding protein YhbY [Allofranklinella schreckenbergeri]